eukprot:4762256-Amphidinium_carterae.1
MTCVGFSFLAWGSFEVGVVPTEGSIFWSCAPLHVAPQQHRVQKLPSRAAPLQNTQSSSPQPHTKNSKALSPQGITYQEKSNTYQLNLLHLLNVFLAEQSDTCLA